MPRNNNVSVHGGRQAIACVGNGLELKHRFVPVKGVIYRPPQRCLDQGRIGFVAHIESRNLAALRGDVLAKAEQTIEIALVGGRIADDNHHAPGARPPARIARSCLQACRDRLLKTAATFGFKRVEKTPELDQAERQWLLSGEELGVVVIAVGDHAETCQWHQGTNRVDDIRDTQANLVNGPVHRTRGVDQEHNVQPAFA